MKCQYCNKNEAVNTFLITFAGGQQEIHVCESCTELGQRYYEKARMAHPGMFRDNAAGGRKVGDVSFPDNAGSEIQRRRQMNILRARLEQAIEKEQYEEAARLRDLIAVQETRGDSE